MSACPLCTSERLEMVLHVARVPLQIGVALPSHQQALSAATGDVRLAQCRDCGLVVNDDFEAERVRYYPGYDVSLTHSPTYRAYLYQEALALVGAHGVRDRAVVELGCGDGYFLRLLCRLGGNSGDGYDPSLHAAHTEAVGEGRVRLHPQEFRPQRLPEAPGLVVARSILELLPDPAGFLRMINAMADPGRPGTLVYLEVPNADWLLGNRMAWNVHYEHRSYFTADTLRRACAAQGMRVLECVPCYVDGQYLRLLAVAGDAPTSVLCLADPRTVESARDFAGAYWEQRSRWSARLASWAGSGLRTVLWGAGGRGTSFLAAVDPGARLVDFTVDANPARHGAFLPVTGHRVCPPTDLRGVGCDVLVISNATYEREIVAAARDEGFEGETWTL